VLDEDLDRDQINEPCPTLEKAERLPLAQDELSIADLDTVRHAGAGVTEHHRLAIYDADLAGGFSTASPIDG
jgi:hypothetical protein